MAGKVTFYKNRERRKFLYDTLQSIGYTVFHFRKKNPEAEDFVYIVQNGSYHTRLML